MHIFCVVPKRLFFSEVLKNKARLKLFPACTYSTGFYHVHKLNFCSNILFHTCTVLYCTVLYCTVLPNFQIVSVVYGKIKINVIRKVITIQFHSTVTPITKIHFFSPSNKFILLRIFKNTHSNLAERLR